MSQSLKAEENKSIICMLTLASHSLVSSSILTAGSEVFVLSLVAEAETADDDVSACLRFLFTAHGASLRL